MNPAPDEREQLMVTASLGLAALVDRMVRDLPEHAQEQVGVLLKNGARLACLCEVVPSPIFTLLLMPPNGDAPIELCSCSPAADSLIVPTRGDVSH